MDWSLETSANQHVTLDLSTMTGSEPYPGYDYLYVDDDCYNPIFDKIKFKKMKKQKIKVWIKTTQMGSFEGLIMLDLWLWKLILKEIEKINRY